MAISSGLRATVNAVSMRNFKKSQKMDHNCMKAITNHNVMKRNGNNSVRQMNTWYILEGSSIFIFNLNFVSIAAL